MSGQPNILYIITHDTGTHLGCYGKAVDTPNLNRLAGEGVRFDRHFCTAPQCSPARASITTGRHPHEVGMMGLAGHGWNVSEDEVTLQKCLREAGYRTWLWGFQHERHDKPETLGYDENPVAYERGEVPKILAENLTPKVCDWLRGKPEGPWFASVGFYETHIDFHKPPQAASDIDRVEPLPYLPDHPAIRQDVAELQASVRVADRAVGDILDALADAGLAEDTLVIFTTDHGIPFPRAKCSLYDPGVNTAMLMRWPGVISENRVEGNLVSGIDLMPTLLDVAGAETPECVSGRSYWPLLVGGDYTPRESIFTELTHHTEYDPTRSIRTHRWKLIRHWDSPRANLQPGDYWDCCAGSAYLKSIFDHPWPERELYDLAADPYEQHNLINTYGMRPKADRLEQEMLRWMESTNDPLLDGPVAKKE